MSNIRILAILLIFPTTAYGIDVCNQTNVYDKYEDFITSPNYPENYPNNTDCSMTIQGPPSSYFYLRIQDFSIEPKKDFVKIFSAEKYAILFNSDISISNNPWHDSKFGLRFTSDGSNNYRGFNISYKFIDPSSLENKTIEFDSFNGIIHPNMTKNSLQKYVIPKWESWKRHVEFYYDSSIKCPNGSSIFVYIDGKSEPMSACSEYRDGPEYDGHYLVIEIITRDVAPNIREIHYVSRRQKGMKKCSPDFSCGEYRATCVPLETRCDGIYDCKEGLDENDCNENSSAIYDPLYDIFKIKSTETQSISIIDDHSHSFLYFINGIFFLLISVMFAIFILRLPYFKRRYGDSLAIRFANHETIPL